MRVTVKTQSNFWSALPRANAALAAMVVITLLLLSLTVDLVPRFHLGDSTIFIITGLRGFIPNNRSWIYGLSVGWLLRTTRLLIAVPLVQIFLCWSAFALFVTSAARAARLRSLATLLLLLVGCLEPLGYYWSRAIMSDSPAQSAFIILSAILLWPFHPVLRFAFALLSGFALVSLRVVYFPAVAAATGLAFIWQCWASSRSGQNKSVFRDTTDRAAWAAAFAAVVFANFLYAGINMHVTGGRVLSTNVGDMEFLAGALSPLMSDELNQTPLTQTERSELIPLKYKNRISSTFNPHGLVLLIRGHFSSTEEARPVLRQLVFDSIRRSPLAFAKLVLRQWTDYLNPSLVLSNQRKGVLSGAAAQFKNDPRVVLPDYVITRLQTWKVTPLPAANSPSTPSAALWYLEACGGTWSLILAYYATFSPLLVLVVPKVNRTAFLVFLNSFAFLYMVTIAVGANQLVTRYLLPLDLPLLYTAAVLLNCRRRNRSAATIQEARNGILEELVTPPAFAAGRNNHLIPSGADPEGARE